MSRTRLDHSSGQDTSLTQSDAAPDQRSDADTRLDELLSKSSLGSPAARGLRRRTDPMQRDRTWLAAQKPGEIIAVHPTTYNDARVIGEHYRRGDAPVLVNLGSVDDDDAKRLVDFMAGLTFGRRGRIQRLSNKIFLLTPETGAENEAK